MCVIVHHVSQTLNALRAGIANIACFHKSGGADNSAVVLLSTEEAAAAAVGLQGAWHTGMTTPGKHLAARYAWRLQDRDLALSHVSKRRYYQLQLVNQKMH